MSDPSVLLYQVVLIFLCFHEYLFSDIKLDVTEVPDTKDCWLKSSDAGWRSYDGAVAGSNKLVCEKMLLNVITL